MSATEETGAPNLDAMPRTELLEWWAAAGMRQTLKVGRKLFPTRPKGYVAATRDLVSYASNKAAAMYCREHGDITGAQVYEIICDRIYDRLPTFARW